MKNLSYILLTSIVLAFSANIQAQKQQQAPQQQQTPRQRQQPPTSQQRNPAPKQQATPQQKIPAPKQQAPQQTPPAQRQQPPKQQPPLQKTPQSKNLQPKPSAPSQPQTNKPQQTAPQQQPEKTNQGGIIVKVNRAIQRGNALAMDMDVRLPNIDLPSHGSMQITLVLIENTTKKNKQMYRLPPIIINGTNKRHMYERAVAISGEEAAKGGAYAVLKSDKDVTQFIQYKKVIPYKSWMSNCQLQLLCEEKNYNDKTIGQFANMVLRKVSITK